MFPTTNEVDFLRPILQIRKVRQIFELECLE
jgi:hypothetical protein